MASKQVTSKKKGIAIPSRYKQAADTFSSQSSKDSTQYTKVSSTRTASPRRSEKDFPRPSSEKDASSIEKSEIIGQCTSSTPTSEGQCSLPPLDESCINNNLSQIPNKKGRKVFTAKKLPLQRNVAANQTSSFFINIPDSHKGQGKVNQANKVDEDEIDLLYAEYLQAKLIESYSIKAYEEKCKDSLEKIYQVWSFIQILISKNMRTQKELNFISHLLTLHEHLHKQEKMLLPVLDAIPSLEKNYEAIAKAVDTAMYNLEVKDVILPDAGSKEEIIQLLNTIGALAQNIINEVQDYDEIIFTSKSKHEFVNLGTLVVEKFKKCSEMLSETSNLVLSETSMKLSCLNPD